MILNIFDLVAAQLLRCTAKCIYSKQVSILISSIASKELQFTNTQQIGEMEILIHALVTAEDRRFFSHYGVDSKGLMRAILLFFTKKKIQGASTITQQLVRVLTKDYRYSVRRKFKEMCLACILDKETPKKTQALIYLNIAYFGWRMYGVTQSLYLLNLTHPLTSQMAASLVSRLRYPEPMEITPQYLEKLNRRTQYIMNIMNR